MLLREEPGTVTLFDNDFKARRDEMVGLVETMVTADSLRLAAYGPDRTGFGSWGLRPTALG
jgi:hypothetical protein